MDPADLKLWAQKWRRYERNSLPWNRARIHLEFARRRAFCRWPVHGNVLELLREGRLELGEHVLLEPGVWLTAPAPGRIGIGGGHVPQPRRPGRRRRAASRSARTACSPTAASSPTATTASTIPTGPCRGRASRTKGPTRIGDNVWCGANVVITSGVTRRRPLRDRGQLGRHARPAAVLDRRRRARDGAARRSSTHSLRPMGPEEQGLVDAIAAREDDLVALLCELIRFDTTSRDAPGEPARDEAALQQHLADRLARRRRRRRRLGAGARGRRRPPAHARERHRLRGPPAARGAPARRRRRPVAAAERPHRRRPRPPRGRLGARSVRPAGRATARIVGRGACDMKGGIAAMVDRGRGARRDGRPARRPRSSARTPTRSRAASAASPARATASRADFAIVPEPTSLEVWPACRGRSTARSASAGRAGHAEQEHAALRATAAPSTRSTRRATCSTASTGCAREWRSAARRAAPPARPARHRSRTRLVADAGWHVTIPDRAEIDARRADPPGAGRRPTAG